MASTPAVSDPDSEVSSAGWVKGRLWTLRSAQQGGLRGGCGHRGPCEEGQAGRRCSGGSFEGTPVNEGGAECGDGTGRDVTSPGPTVSRAPLQEEEPFERSCICEKGGGIMVSPTVCPQSPDAWS